MVGGKLNETVTGCKLFSPNAAQALQVVLRLRVKPKLLRKRSWRRGLQHLMKALSLAPGAESLN